MVSEEQFSLKNIFTKEESGEADEFHVSQKYLGQNSSKTSPQKKVSWILYVFQIQGLDFALLF